MANNKIHTIIIGTSKSRNEDAYYVKSRKNFWGLLYHAGITSKEFEPTDYKKFTDLYGIGFAELAFDHAFVGEDEMHQPIKNDHKLKDELHLLNESIPKLMVHLKKEKPERIVFNGKSATAGFYHYIKNGNVGKLDSGYVKELGFSYGKIGNWDGIEVWMLPNLSAAAGNEWKVENGEEKWLQFWRSIADQTKTVSKLYNKIWLWILLIAFLTVLFIRLKK